MKLGFALDLLLQVTDRMRAADRFGWRCHQPTNPARPRPRSTRARSVPAPRLWSHGGQCHTRSGGSAGPAGPLSAKAGSSPTQTVAERTRAPTRRSVSWRRKPTAGDDRIPAASACLRRVAERRARQSQRSPHRGAGCRQNSIAQCLWLVQAHAASHARRNQESGVVAEIAYRSSPRHYGQNIHRSRTALQLTEKPDLTTLPQGSKAHVALPNIFKVRRRGDAPFGVAEHHIGVALQGLDPCRIVSQLSTAARTWIVG